MGNGPRGTAPGPFPLIVILRGGAVPPNSGAVPPPLYITIRGNSPGAVPPGPFPMDKLDGPSGMSTDREQKLEKNKGAVQLR